MDSHYALLRRLTLVPLGGGTGNGLIATLLHEKHMHKDVVSAAFLGKKHRRVSGRGLPVVARQCSQCTSAMLFMWCASIQLPLCSC